MRRSLLALTLLTTLDVSAAVRTQRFSVDSTLAAEERAAVLESAYSEFLFVSNVLPPGLPGSIRVTVHPDEARFRVATGHRGAVVRSSDTITTFEQPNMNSLLMGQTVSLLFDAATAGRAGADATWLRSGLIDAVEIRRSGMDVSEQRARMRLALKREGPVTLDVLLGKIPPGGESGSLRRYRASAASLTAYLLDLEGGLGIRFLLAEIARGRTLGEAVGRAYSGRFRDMDELFGIWLDKEVGVVRRDAPARR